MTTCPLCGQPAEPDGDLCPTHAATERLATLDLLDEEYERVFTHGGLACHYNHDATIALHPNMPGDHRYGAAALRGTVTDFLESAATDGRNVALNRAAFRLGRLIAGGHADQQTCTDTLFAAADAVGLPGWEARDTITRGLRDGHRKAAA